MRKSFIAGTAIALGLGLMAATPSFAEEIETYQRTETTTYSGSVQGFQPAESVIMLQTTEKKVPSAYKYSKTTKFVDESGTEISSERVSEEIVQGRQATIHIDPTSNVVSRVMLRPMSKTTTTTTETEIND